MIKFSQRLQELRLSKNLTRKQLADVIGVTEATMRKWETRPQAVRSRTLIKLAVFFDVSIDYLVGRKPKKNG